MWSLVVNGSEEPNKTLLENYLQTLLYKIDVAVHTHIVQRIPERL